MVGIRLEKAEVLPSNRRPGAASSSRWGLIHTRAADTAGSGRIALVKEKLDRSPTGAQRAPQSERFSGTKRRERTTPDGVGKHRNASQKRPGGSRRAIGDGGDRDGGGVVVAGDTEADGVRNEGSGSVSVGSGITNAALFRWPEFSAVVIVGGGETGPASGKEVQLVSNHWPGCMMAWAIAAPGVVSMLEYKFT